MTDCLEDAINYLLDQEQFQLAHLLCASHNLEKTQIHSKWTKKLILNGDYNQAAFYNLFFNDINTFVDLSLASGKRPRLTEYRPILSVYESDSLGSLPVLTVLIDVQECCFP